MTTIELLFKFANLPYGGLLMMFSTLAEVIRFEYLWLATLRLMLLLL